MAHAPHSRPEIPPAQVLKTLPPDGGENWNRLVFEKSPYLLQHAANPVDWWPWSEEAFAEAKRRDLPVFLSIGYSTCHWCHVMERESFENEEIGALMNEAFVCIKVDREERPDVDNVYMTVTQALTGSGGWPMTVLLTPEKKPFYAATYLPPESRYNRPGMRDFVPHIGKLWKEERQRLLDSASMIVNELGRIVETMPGDFPTTELLDLNVRVFLNRFDRRHGGFGNRPKFPVPHNLMFLLREFQATGNADVLQIVERTLKALRLGGIYDQVGFGFHRYSTDERWLLPHFEKMLYDQALLLLAYSDAHQTNPNEPLYERTIREVIAYLDRDMKSPEGAYFSAEDADSEGVEGKFYVYASGELDSVLGSEEAAHFEKEFHFEKDGNFHEEATGEDTGLNIPHLRDAFPTDFKRLDKSREKVLAYRSKRIRPLRDEKILTDWNGLLIAALSRAGVVLGDEVILERARITARFFLDKMRNERGHLYKRALAGEYGLPGLHEDYAFLAWGLLELHQATLEPEWLAASLQLTGLMRELFEDKQIGGFFQTAHGAEALIMRLKSHDDGAIPSGNSVAALLLAKLGRLLGRDDFEESARRTIQAFSPSLQSQPGNSSMMLQAIQFLLRPSAEIVLVGPMDEIKRSGLLETMRAGFRPGALLMHLDPQAPSNDSITPEYMRSMVMIENKPTVYLCRNFACERPVTSAEEFRAMLERLDRTENH